MKADEIKIGQRYTNVFYGKPLTVELVNIANGMAYVVECNEKRKGRWICLVTLRRYYQPTPTLVTEATKSETIKHLPQYWQAARSDAIIKIINYDHPTVTAQVIKSRRRERGYQTTMTYSSLRNRYRPMEQLFEPNNTKVQVGMKLVARRSDSLLEVVEVGEQAVIARYIKTNDRKFRPGDHTKMSIASMRNNYTVQSAQ